MHGDLIEWLEYNHNNELSSHSNNIKDDNGNIIETLTLKTNEYINPYTSSYVHEYVKFEDEIKTRYLYDDKGRCIEEYYYHSTNKNNISEAKIKKESCIEYPYYISYIDRDCVNTTKELLSESKKIYSYNDNGKIIEEISGEIKTIFKYDNNDNIIEIYSSSDSTNYTKYIFKYDNNKRCIEEIEINNDKYNNKYIYNEEKTTIKYDNNGNIIEMCNYKKDNKLSSKQIIIYDSMNNVIETRLYDCSMGVDILDSYVKIDIKYRI